MRVFNNYFITLDFLSIFNGRVKLYGQLIDALNGINSDEKIKNQQV